MLPNQWRRPDGVCPAWHFGLSRKTVHKRNLYRDSSFDGYMAPSARGGNDGGSPWRLISWPMGRPARLNKTGQVHEEAVRRRRGMDPPTGQVSSGVSRGRTINVAGTMTA